MTLTIRAPGALNEDTMDRSGSWTEDNESLLVVDLRKCFFCGHIRSGDASNGHHPRINEVGDVEMQLPNSKSAQTYFTRIRFFDLLPAEVVLRARPPPSMNDRSCVALRPQRCGGLARALSDPRAGPRVQQNVPPQARNDMAFGAVPYISPALGM